MATNKIATDVELIYILELPKIPLDDDNRKLWTWLKFLKSNSVEETKKIKNKIPEVDEAMNIYKKYMSDEEYKDYIETRELMAQMDKNEYYFEGLAEGETNAKIEAVINLMQELNLSLDKAMTVLKIDASYKSQIETKLKELGIKYN